MYNQHYDRRAEVTTVLAFLPALVILDDRGGQLPSWSPKIALCMSYLLPPGVEWLGLRGPWVAAAAAAPARLLTFPHQGPELFSTSPWWLHGRGTATRETRHPLPTGMTPAVPPFPCLTIHRLDSDLAVTALVEMGIKSMGWIIWTSLWEKVPKVVMVGGVWGLWEFKGNSSPRNEKFSYHLLSPMRITNTICKEQINLGSQGFHQLGELYGAVKLQKRFHFHQNGVEQTMTELGELFIKH